MNRNVVYAAVATIFLLVAGGCSTVPKTEDVHHLVERGTLEVTATQAELFWLANNWMERKLVPKGQDAARGDGKNAVIVGEGAVFQRGTLDVLFEFPYRLSVEVADGAARATVEVGNGKGTLDSGGGDTMMITEAHLMPPQDYQELKGKVRSIIDDLFSYFKSGAEGLQYNDTGIAKAKSGDFVGAAEDFTKGIELLPYFSGLYDDRAIARRYLGDYDGAIADHTRAIELDPGEWRAYSNRGNTRSMMGDYEAAIADHSKAIELNPDDLRPYLNRGNVKAQLKDYEGAIADFSTACRLAPENPIPLNQRGWTYLKVGNYAQTVSDLDQAISLSADASYYDTRGWGYFYLGKYAEARQDALSALALDPESYSTRVLLYRIDVQRGHKEQAVQALKDYVSARKGGETQGGYFLVLRYLMNEVDLASLEANPQWEDLRVTLMNYSPAR